MHEHTLTDQCTINSMTFPQATLIDWKFPAHVAQLFRVPQKCPQHGQVKNKAQNLHLSCIDFPYT